MKNNKHTETIHVRLTPDEKRYIAAAAARERRTMSDYLAMAGLERGADRKERRLRAWRKYNASEKGKRKHAEQHLRNPELNDYCKKSNIVLRESGHADKP